MRIRINNYWFVALFLAVFVAGCSGSGGGGVLNNMPSVTSTYPVNHAVGVLTNSIITASFSRAMNPATVTTATFTTENGATPVSGTVTYAGTMASFTPTVNLMNNTLYTAVISKGVISSGGTSDLDDTLAGNYSWTFTTGPVGVAISPQSTTLDISTPNVSNTQQFTASVTNNANTAFTWSVVGGNANGTIAASGLYTAPTISGIYQVKATSVADPTASATATVTVQSGDTIITVN